MNKLTILVGLVMALALALPSSASAAALVEVKKLTASNAQAGDRFGVSVAVSGDTAIVGARREDAGGTDAGAAYVFERNQDGPDNWGEVVKLTASDAQADDQFGSEVAINGDTAIVGAFLEDAGGSAAGAAYVFERNQGGTDNWGEVTKLTGSIAQTNDFFGRSVAISGDTVIVGASNRNVAFVFERDQGGLNNWGEVQVLFPSSFQFGDLFGRSVAISAETALVGAQREDAGGSDAGAAYVFERNLGVPDSWGQVKKLTASDAQGNDQFGRAVAISGDSAIVGGLSADAAYVFERTQGGPDNWGEVKKLTGSDAQFGDLFGVSVAISAETALVGAQGEDAGGVAAGAAYQFERNQGGPGDWGEVAKLAAAPAFANFGHSLTISGDTAIVGAFLEDGSVGAAYVFEASPVSVGGLVVDLDRGPLSAAQPAGGRAGVLAGTIAGIAVLAVALTGAAWYTRRRL